MLTWFHFATSAQKLASRTLLPPLVRHIAYPLATYHNPQISFREPLVRSRRSKIPYSRYYHLPAWKDVVRKGGYDMEKSAWKKRTRVNGKRFLGIIYPPMRKESIQLIPKSKNCQD